LAPKNAHLDDTTRDLEKGGRVLVQRVEDDGNHRREARDDADNDTCGESMHAINGTHKEEQERNQNEHGDRLMGIKSSGSVSEQERKKTADQDDQLPRGEAEGLSKRDRIKENSAIVTKGVASFAHDG